MNVEENISSLKDITRELMKLHSISIELSTKGEFKYNGNQYKCTVSKSKAKTSSMIAMFAGQSVMTILKLSDWRGIPVMDLYPIARSILESHVNATYILSSDDSVSEKAIRYVEFASHKFSNRNIGTGDYSIKISNGSDLSGKFDEFKKNSSWTNLKTPERIAKVGELAGSLAANKLSAAYALIYYTSSEIIHGSPYGINFFFQAHMSKGSDYKKFEESSAKHVEDILIVITLTLSGYLSAFFNIYSFKDLEVINQELFDKVMVISGAKN